MVDGGASSVSEFARHADGSLAELSAPNDCIGTVGNGQCATAVGLNFPDAIAVSPDGKNVYVVGTDTNNIGNIAEFARNADGSLTQLGGANGCIGETETSTKSVCGTTSGHGLSFPTAVAVSPDGAKCTSLIGTGAAIAEFARGASGSLTQLASPNNCIQEHNPSPVDCGTVTGTGLSGASSVAISADGANVYVGAGDSIAEFTRAAGGALTQLASPNNCIEDHTASTPDCVSHTGIGISEVASLDLSPDGNNLYTVSSDSSGAVAEFARHANGSLTQLGGANSCIEENATGQGGQPAAGCGTQTGHGLGRSSAIKVSPDGANVYVASLTDDCGTTAVTPSPSSAAAPTDRLPSSQARTTASRSS